MAKRRWSDMGRAEKYALIQGQVLMWACVLAVTYFVATRVSVVLAAIYIVPLLVAYVWMIRRIRRS